MLNITEIVVFLLVFRLQYRDAFIAMRRHRINLNLMHDHNSKVRLTLTDENVRLDFWRETLLLYPSCMSPCGARFYLHMCCLQFALLI